MARNLALAVLEICGPQGGVGIGGRAEKRAQVRLGMNPLVQAAADADRHAHLLPIGVLDEVQRIDCRVDDVAEQIAHRGRPNQGNDQVGAWTNTIPAERIAKGTRAVRQASRAGHVDHPAKTHGGVHHQPDRRSARAGRSQLQHVIDDDHRLAQIDENVVKGLSDRAWRQGVKNDADEAQTVASERHLEGEAAAIEVLEGVVHLAGDTRGGVTGTGGARERENQAGNHQLFARVSDFRPAIANHAPMNFRSHGSRLAFRFANGWKHSLATIRGRAIAYRGSEW